jgi:hypothetical protein
MTGQVPYYGGRITPTQAYALQHGGQAPPGRWQPQFGGPATVAPRGGAAESSPADEARASLLQLRDTGVLTEQEYEAALSRITA